MMGALVVYRRVLRHLRRAQRELFLAAQVSRDEGRDAIAMKAQSLHEEARDLAREVEGLLEQLRGD